MPATIVRPLVHSPDEHNIAVMPDSESREQIVAVQNQLKSLLGDAIWTPPSHALHSTVMEIICHTDYQGLSRKELFKDWYEHYDQLVAETLAQFGPIDLTFTELLASPAAIILKAQDPTPLNAIREAILAHTTLPPHTKMPPDIAHVSIARYSESVDLDEVKKRISGIIVDIHMHSSEFKLMKDLGPDFHSTVLGTYKLAKQ